MTARTPKHEKSHGVHRMHHPQRPGTASTERQQEAGRITKTLARRVPSLLQTELCALSSPSRLTASDRASQQCVAPNVEGDQMGRDEKK